ncbi:MAG: protein-L-isoaspartate O-methyltransferase, partial [Bacteroidota bacterium]
AGAPEIPKLLAAQLAIGGIMVIPVGDKNIQQMVTLVRKSDKKFERIVYDQFKFVPLMGEEGW